MKTLENPFLLIGALEHAGSPRIAPLRCNDLSARTENSMETLSFQARIGNQQTTRMDPPRKQTCMGLEGGSIITDPFSDLTISVSLTDRVEERKRNTSFGYRTEVNSLWLPVILKQIAISTLAPQVLFSFKFPTRNGNKERDRGERKRRKSENKNVDDRENRILKGDMRYHTSFEKMLCMECAKFSKVILFARHSQLAHAHIILCCELIRMLSLSDTSCFNLIYYVRGRSGWDCIVPRFVGDWWDLVFHRRWDSVLQTKLGTFFPTRAEK